MTKTNDVTAQKLNSMDLASLTWRWQEQSSELIRLKAEFARTEDCLRELLLDEAAQRDHENRLEYEGYLEWLETQPQEVVDRHRVNLGR